jgi:hypothetical protein
MKESLYFIKVEEEGFKKFVSFTPNRPDKNFFFTTGSHGEQLLSGSCIFLFCPPVCSICCTNYFSPPYCIPVVFLKFPVFLNYSSPFHIHHIFIHGFC